jgi:hypothetical protein
MNFHWSSSELILLCYFNCLLGPWNIVSCSGSFPSYSSHAYSFSINNFELLCYKIYKSLSIMCLYLSSPLSFCLPFLFCAGIYVGYLNTKFWYTTYSLPLQLLKVLICPLMKLCQIGCPPNYNLLTLCNWILFSMLVQYTGRSWVGDSAGWFIIMYSL